MESKDIFLGTEKTSSIFEVIDFQLDDLNYRLLIDTVEPVRTTVPSTITRHPVPDGDMVADHMFRRPIVVQVSGTFSSRGSQQSLPGVDNASSWLSSVQTLFERVEHEGIKCTVSQISYGQSGKIRFKQRPYMALSSISWTEHIDSLDFSFTFEEVITVDVNEVVPNSEDEGSLIFTAPIQCSFADDMLDENTINLIIYKTMKDLGLITDSFMGAVEAAGLGALAGIGTIGLLGATAAGASIVSFISTSTAVGLTISAAAGPAAPVVIVATAAVVVAAAVALVFTKVQENKKKVRFKTFALTGDDAKDSKRVKEFVKFWGDVQDVVKKIDQDVTLYKFPEVSDDQNQILTLSFDQDLYDFEIVKNAESSDHTLTISVNGVPKVTTCMETRALINFTNATNDDALMEIANQNLYLICPFENDDEGRSLIYNHRLALTSLDPNEIQNKIYDNLEHYFLSE